jgi:hypothetical protein
LHIFVSLLIFYSPILSYYVKTSQFTACFVLRIFNKKPIIKNKNKFYRHLSHILELLAPKIKPLKLNFNHFCCSRNLFEVCGNVTAKYKSLSPEAMVAGL